MTNRELVINSFDQDHMCGFSHVVPFRYTNFIDGMAWVSVLAGASHMVGDTEVENLCVRYLTTLVTVGDDARNFAPFPVKDNWLPSRAFQGYYYKEKPQSFAGPCSYLWASECGCALPTDFVDDVRSTAKLYCWLAPLYGLLVNRLDFLKQHLNSVMFAHMLVGKKPPSSLEWTTKDNPFYAYLYGTTVDFEYSKHVSAWPAKHVWGYDEDRDTYTPVCQLASEYLQSTL